MKLFGIGIDVVEVERIESSIAQFGMPFVARIFTEAEQRYSESQHRPGLHYAARFAAKEAVAKALGTGIGKDLGWLDMEIVRKPSGAPELLLTGVGKRFAERNQITEVMISLSHARDYAAANAVVMVGGFPSE